MTTTAQTNNATGKKARLATVWLDGCSGCHMSLLDMDERLIGLAALVDVVYSPVADPKEYPEHVDVALVEGAVSSNEDLHKIKLVRKRTKILVALGDCAITANVPSMRNPYKPEALLQRVYVEGATIDGQIPNKSLPTLLERSRPIHEIVKVDLYIPGCPPSADTIHYAVTELLAGRIPDLSSMTRFGA
jgi:NAD-reducing hydrogenase small subunit